MAWEGFWRSGEIGGRCQPKCALVYRYRMGLGTEPFKPGRCRHTSTHLGLKILGQITDAKNPPIPPMPPMDFHK